MVSAAAQAQSTNQIKPRVLLMVDTSGSMNFYLANNNPTGGDGSDTYISNAGVSRSQATTPGFALYEGYETNTPLVCAPHPVGPFEGSKSRLFNAKAAISNVINGSGDVDWGLMRYNGTDCSFSSTFNARGCTKNSNCASGQTCNGSGNCTCTNDNDCNYGEFCNDSTKVCGTDPNLCYTGNNLLVGMTDTRNKTTCGNHSGGETNTAGGNLPQTFQGGCGTNAGAGSTACGTPEGCSVDSDCGTGGKCVTNAALGVKWCSCASGGTCNGNWSTCSGAAAGNWCLYSQDCVGSNGGTVLIDPSAAGFSSNQVLPWINNIEIYKDLGGSGSIASRITDPELRANGGTPLAGAARAATAWYSSIATAGSDTKIDCRPYVLVQLTDGVDSCDSNNNDGPVAAAAGFVAATHTGAKNPNRVYVIGLSTTLSADVTELNKIAAAGGTGQARFANSQAQIQSALADIVASSVLVEKCNGIDDNCNGQCDENFPGVAVTGATCTNQHSASTCDNAGQGQCFATGVFVCSADGLSQVCSAPSCTAQSGASIASGTTNIERLTGTTGITAGNVGQVLFVSGSTKVANNGGFLIAAVAGGNVDLTNTGVVLPDASSVSYALPQTQGKGTTVNAAGTVTLTVTTGSTSGLAVGDNIFILGGATAGSNGQFTISALGANTITYSNATAPAADTVTWAVDICKGVETCNGLDDDCDGIIDNCGGSTPGSCCTSNCPACAKAPFIETCNNCDDDCDGIIDNHLVDTGLSCGNNVGDCAGGTTQCCSNDPNASACMLDRVNDKIWCKSGNPPYPTATDLCDGTDDNCNGVANDEPPLSCFTDGTNTLPMGKDGVGVCHHGIEQCQTLPLCGTTLPPGCIPGACPAGWPAGKTCPNPTPVYGSCLGLIAPTPEFCDGLDNDCNACTDDNPQDAWIGTACCSTGNLADCDNTGTGTRCKRGTWKCAQPGGACTAGTKTCVGSVAKSTEICNMVDDDCNGPVDDVPGVGAPCTGPGIFTQGTCKAVEQCVANNMPPQCVQTVGPGMETCNGLDDNCNGQIDDNNPPNAVNPLPGVGVPCMVPMPPQDKPPCKAGATVCVAGAIVCQGAVGPMPNQCNGISSDCTGNANTNGNCPTGFQCYQGNCVAPCDPGEFPCPGGYACNMNTTACDGTSGHVGCCVPDACAQTNCPAGFNCQLDANGMGVCVDPCQSVTCPPTYICKLGACVDGSCRTQGCPDGQVCVAQPDNSFACQPDPCADVTCGTDQFCQNGTCVGTCAGPCPKNQFCSGGTCVPDPCASTPCVEGQVCQIQNGVPVCVENQCQFGCNIGQACCGGQCVADGCENLHCPEDTHCSLTPDCAATCETNPASPKDQIVGAGGGGFGCAVAGHGSAPSASLAWLLIIAGAALFRRRRAVEVRK
ncbi:MAG TPA: MopE-related protein [Polyangia bacterium]|nr:MopE-related protein [Polyangia bacterium]